MPLSEGIDEVHWIQPPPPPISLRNDDGTAKLLPLSGMNQIYTPCNQVFILPGPIDVERLKMAITSWLILVPHAAGRLVRGPNHTWAIKLSYPIPVTLSSYSGTYADEQLYDGFPPFLDPLPWVHYPTGDPEMHPLVRFKITNITSTGETAVAIHTCHIVADGVSLFRMLNMLSDLYCGSSVNEQVPVSFENFLGPLPPPLDPESEKYKRALDRTPILKNTYTPEQIVDKWMEFGLDNDRVDLFITKEQTDALLRRANASRPASAKSLTTTNALSAYLFTLLNRVYGHARFNRILSVLEIRGKKTPEGSLYQFPSKASGAMSIVLAASDPFPPERLLSLSALATDIREHNLACLVPETLLDITSVYEQRQSELAQAQGMAWMLPENGDGILAINLMHKTDVRVHFGFGADKCRFFTWAAIKHYVRAFKANPIKSAEGKWLNRDDVVHLIFAVDKGFGNKVRELAREDLDALVLEDIKSQRVSAKL